MNSNQKLFYNLISVLTFIVILMNSLLAQAPDTLWTLTFSDSGHSEGNCVQKTADGGYVMLGTKLGMVYRNKGNILLIKIDAIGDVSWAKTVSKGRSDNGYCVQQTSNEDYIITGATNQGVLFATGWSSIGLIKTNASGDTLWTKTFSDTGEYSYNKGYAVRETFDDGYIICGFIGRSSPGPYWKNIWLIKTDSYGDTIWTKTYDRAYQDFGFDVQVTADSGYVIIGKTAENIWLLKTDSFGDTLWTKTFGDSVEGKSSGQQTSDGGYIILGTKQSAISGKDIFMIKTDNLGNIQWTKTYGGGDDEIGNSIQQTSDGGYIITGQTRSVGSGGGDVWLIKTDALGDTLWTRTFGDGGNETGKSVIVTTDGGYLIAGNNDTLAWLIKTTPDPMNLINKSIGKISEFKLSQNFPNPFNSTTKIEFFIPKSDFVTLKVYNILGKKVATLVSEKLSAGKYNYDWVAKNFASGIYYYKLETETFAQTRKLILLK